MSINVIFSIPAATDPFDVEKVLDGYWEDDTWIAGAGYKTIIPTQGVMPASAKGGGKALVHANISGATYQDILDVTTAQRPVWQIFGAIESHSDTVYEPVNNSVWQLLPPLATEIHTFQGHAPWPSKP